MAEDTQAAPHQSARPESHVGAAANPEQHLLDSHKLSIQIQGKEGPTGRAVWALIREERGKVKTLTVFLGTRREAAAHFYKYVHPDQATAPSPTFRSAPRGSSRPPQRSRGRR